MKKYYAIMEIGGYPIGAEVPAEKAELWLKVYDIKPVKIVDVPDLFPKELDVNKDGKVDVSDKFVAEDTAKKVKNFLSKRHK